ncbi:hypothetical protein J2TS4_00150 [Paenibacillus sp. J2TS4]|nr:hypothetical protein J2TS4_00150 [Paenibacillus sp. J2TS4]
MLLLAAVLISSGLPVVQAEESQDGDYLFDTKSDPDGNEYAVITKYTGNETELTIPDTLDGKPVKEIGRQAFYEKGLESVNIPDSVTSLGEGAFRNNQLESVNIPDSVTSLGEGAFRNNQLESVTIPDSVTSLGKWAFHNNQLTSVMIPDSVTNIGDYAFAANQLESVTIPDSVTSLGKWAFHKNQLESVTIPDSVKNIGDGAFANNPLNVIMGELASAAQTYAEKNGILFLNFDPWSSGGQVQKEAATTVTALWDNTFSLQYQWTTTEVIPALPNEPDSNGWTTFQSGDTLRHSVDDTHKIDSAWYVHIYAQDEEGGTLFAVHSGAFLLEEEAQDSDYLYEVKSDTDGNEYAVITGYTGSETELIIPDTLDGNPVKGIGVGAFKDKGLIRVTIPDGVTSIDNGAFHLNKLNSVDIPDGVTSIGGYAFAANQLKSVKIPDSVTSMGNYAFAYNKLTDVTVPNGVRTIESQAFLDNQLESVIIQDGVTRIGKEAFRNNKITHVTIPDSVTNIGEGAFHTNQLQSVTIGQGVTVIGSSAFYGNQLTEVTIPGSVTSIEQHAFRSNQLARVMIPDSVTNIGNYAFDENEFESVMIPGNVTNIGDGAFRSNTIKVIIGELGSAAQTYAENNDILFLNFDPWSSGGQAQKEASTTVKALWSKAFSLFYQWTTTEEALALPYEPDGNGWTVFQSGDTLRHSVDDTQTIDNTWYVHIYAEDEGGRKIFAVHSGAFLLEGELQDGDYLYEMKSDIDGNEYAVITGYIGNETDLTIPDTLEGKPVKEIGDSAFALKKLTRVTIPDSVTEIGDRAFYANWLKSVVIGNSVTVIGSGAFDSNQLERVIIPDSVTHLGNGAFRYNGLKSVQIGNSVESIGAQTFASNQLTSVTFPDSLLIIDFQAFYKNQLQKVSIPDNVKSIENSAFEENQLTSVQIGHSVESIGASAFASNRLTSIKIPNKVTLLGPSLFRNNPLKVIIGELASAAQTYAESNGILFLNFDPWSSGGQVQKEAQTTVTAIWNKEFSLQYQWTLSEEEPVLPTEPEGNEWNVFESGDPLRHSLDDAQTIDNTWYVHIYAQDEDGSKLFAVHSGAFLLEVPEQVAKPVAHPAGGEVPPGTKVSLSTETEDATIYYTLDGSTPSSSSMEYTAPIEVTAEMTIKAIAVKAGMLDSEVMTESYTILQPEQVAKPVAEPSGSTVLSGTKVTLSTTTEGATIFYTTDGSAPTRSSMEYTAPIEVASEMMIKAIAVKAGMLDSEVMTESYTILHPEQVAKPVAEPSGSAVLSGTKVTLSTVTEGATIYYTTDGSAPIRNSMKYTAPIEVASEMTIKAIAVKAGMLDSEVMVEHYTILQQPNQVAKPVADPTGGAVLSGTKVTLSTVTEGATIYYTTDGSAPTRSSMEYTAPIEVTAEMTIKAIAVKAGMLDSEVMEEQYTIATIPAPANLTASAADRSVTLKWNAVTGTGSVTYAVYQAEGTSAPADPANWKLIQSNVTANSYIVTGLTNGKTYAFAVKAISVEGASDFSNVAIATPRAPRGNSGSGGGGGGRVLSNNADLADLQVWAEGKQLNLSPTFASGTTEYTARTEAEQVELVVNEAHSVAKVILHNKVMTDRVKVDLEEDKNTFVFTVQAENGTKKKYTLTIYRDVPKPTEPVIELIDIAGHWAENYIKRATVKGIVSGYPDGTFKPNNPVTRTEFTAMLAGAMKLEGDGSALTFTDHDRIGGWAKQAVARAVQAGIVDGYSDGSFRPNEKITRAEMAAMIARTLKLQLNANATTGFADDEAIPQWAKGAVEVIRKLGIVDGRGGNRFAANETATRAEATVMLLRMLDHK